LRLLGYVPQSARVTVGQGPVTQDFVLAEQAISLSPVDVVVGSRARHTAAEQLAVPVDVFTAEEIAQQGTNETSQILSEPGAVGQLPAPKRHGRERYRASLHAARFEPRSHARAPEPVGAVTRWPCSTRSRTAWTGSSGVDLNAFAGRRHRPDRGTA